MSNEEYQKLINSLIEPSKQMIQNGKNIEDVLKYLKTQSNSKIVSIAVITKIINISIGDAKLLVHTSKTWGSVRARDENFHEKIISAIEQILTEEDSGC